jgi:enoyl-CoA hydratase/carnithine racemase
MSETIQFEIADRLCRLTLNRPERLNALNVDMFKRMEDLLDGLDLSQVDCLLLTGAGRSFCAGHDLDHLASGAENTMEAEHLENRVIERLSNLPFPVIAKVQGHCYTGGLELVLCADIIVAGADAKFADTHSKFDLVPVWGLTQRLPRRVGLSKAKEMMFASRTYSGVQAGAMGLADIVVDSAELDQEVDKLCKDILANSSRSNRELKKLLTDTDGLNLAAGVAWELHRTPGHGPGFAQVIAEKRRTLQQPKS